MSKINIEITIDKFESGDARVQLNNGSIDIWIGEDFDFTEDQAIIAAKLFKHSPELLQFINNIQGEMLRNDFVLCEKWVEKAEELIKKINNHDDRRIR